MLYVAVMAHLHLERQVIDLPASRLGLALASGLWNNRLCTTERWQSDGEHDEGGPGWWAAADVVRYVEALLGRGIELAEWEALVEAGEAPLPHRYVGRTPLWMKATIEEWAGSASALSCANAVSRLPCRENGRDKLRKGCDLRGVSYRFVR